MLANSPLRDVAVGEQFEFGAGESAEVQLRSSGEPTGATTPEDEPLRPRLALLSKTAGLVLDEVNRVEIHNARPVAIPFELRLRLDPAAQLVAADHTFHTRNGQPVFALRIPAAGRAIVRYQIGHSRQH